MSNKKIVSVTFITIFSVGILFSGIYFLAFQSSSLPNKANQDLLNKAIPQEKVNYIINNGQAIQSYEVALTNASSTIFSALQIIAQNNDFPVVYKTYPEMGVLVETIGDTTSGFDNKYWQYWVNGTLGEVACDKKLLNSGDVVEWKFDTIPAF